MGTTDVVALKIIIMCAKLIMAYTQIAVPAKIGIARRSSQRTGALESDQPRFTPWFKLCISNQVTQTLIFNKILPT